MKGAAPGGGRPIPYLKQQCICALLAVYLHNYFVIFPSRYSMLLLYVLVTPAVVPPTARLSTSSDLDHNSLSF